MEQLINLLVGDLALSQEFIFVARCIVLCLVVEGLASLLSALVPLSRLR